MTRHNRHTSNAFTHCTIAFNGIRDYLAVASTFYFFADSQIIPKKIKRACKPRRWTVQT